MWKFNKTDNLPGNSLYHSADELYHYGIPGMKWKNHVYKTYDYGSVGRNLAGRIRNSQMRSTKSRISSDSKELKKMNSNYKWMQKNHADLKKNGGKIANSKLLSGIRQHRMNQLKKKIGITKDSIKEDRQIMKELKGYEKTARQRATNKAAAKKILAEAKTRYKSANKQYSKDFNNYYNNATRFGVLSDITKNQKRRNNANLYRAEQSAKKYNSAKSAYKKAKANYKKYK